MAGSSSAPAAGPFELSGGALCLDFANTWGDRGRPETDGLAGYGEVLAFALQTGVIGARERSRLARQATAAAAEAGRAGDRARELREAIYAVFAARARRRTIAPGDVAAINRELREALPHLRLAPASGAFAWRWSAERESLLSPLWPIVRSAAELLTSPDLARVRECDGATCTWLFLDRSRSHSRRWCSMVSCGNRAKAQRHYRRQHGD